jgi:hypothetical protein
MGPHRQIRVDADTQVADEVGGYDSGGTEIQLFRYESYSQKGILFLQAVFTQPVKPTKCGSRPFRKTSTTCHRIIRRIVDHVAQK